MSSLKKHWCQIFLLWACANTSAQCKYMKYSNSDAAVYIHLFSSPFLLLILMVHSGCNLNIPFCSQYCIYFCQLTEKRVRFPLSLSISYSGFDRLIHQYVRDWLPVFETWKTENLRWAKQHGCTLSFSSACFRSQLNNDYKIVLSIFFAVLITKFLSAFIWFRSLVGFLFSFSALCWSTPHTLGGHNCWFVWRYQKSGSLIIQIFIVIALRIVCLIKDIEVLRSWKWLRQKYAL